MKVFILDNYDSFTYNLYQFIGEILQTRQSVGEIDNFDITVKRNDEVTLEEIEAAQPDRIIISPGPGSPDDASYFGVCAEVIEKLGPAIPLLGVCLGMQGIVHVHGGKICKAPVPMHGKISPISHTGQGLFENIPDQLEVMRYHSLIADPATFPHSLQVTALTGDITEKELEALADSQGNNGVAIPGNGEFEIMAVRHREHPIFGIQFHPESFATEGGKELIANFLFLPGPS